MHDQSYAVNLQVLQDSAPDGGKVAALFGEADTLRSQLQVYQRDREQLINALTAKHQESVGFYEEAQRLSTRLSELNNELEQRAQTNSSLAQQYEEKQRALYSALNELSTLRQRRSELERQLANRPAEVVGTRSKEESPSSAVTFSMESDDDEQSAATTVTADGLPHDLRRYKDIVAEKEIAIGERQQRIVKLEQAIADRETLMEERQHELISAAAKLRQFEEAMSARNSELTAMRKQCESLNFDLQGVTSERSELARERDALVRKVESVTAELLLLRSTNEGLTAAATKKDFELDSMKNQVSSLAKLVESAGRGEQHDGEVKMLMVQLEGLRRQMETLQQERNSAFQELRHHQSECTELRNKVDCCLYCSIFCSFTLCLRLTFKFSL